MTCTTHPIAFQSLYPKSEDGSFKLTNTDTGAQLYVADTGGSWSVARSLEDDELADFDCSMDAVAFATNLLTQ